jgi:hypothetical protein
MQETFQGFENYFGAHIGSFAIDFESSRIQLSENSQIDFDKARGVWIGFDCPSQYAARETPGVFIFQASNKDRFSIKEISIGIQIRGMGITSVDFGSCTVSEQGLSVVTQVRKEGHNGVFKHEGLECICTLDVHGRRIPFKVNKERIWEYKGIDQLTMSVQRLVPFT